MFQTQFLHCIHQFKGEGGDSIFSDGFKVAEDIRSVQHTLSHYHTLLPRFFLRKNFPKEWKLLTETPLIFWDQGTEEISGEYYKFNVAPIITSEKDNNMLKNTSSETL